MTVAALQALETVRVFLTERILAAVPKDMRPDVRAAAKLMENVQGELDALYPMLMSECHAMMELCRETSKLCPADEQLRRIGSAAAALAQPLPSSSLQELAACHADWCVLVADLAVVLRRGAGGAVTESLLPKVLETLEQQALARVTWQSVFPLGSSFADLIKIS